MRTTYAGGESGAMPFAGDGQLLRRAGVRCAPVLVSGLFWLPIGEGPSASSPRHPSPRHPSGQAGQARQAGRAAGRDEPGWIKVSPADALYCGASVLCIGCMPTASQGQYSTNVRICQRERALLPCEGLVEMSFEEWDLTLRTLGVLPVVTRGSRGRSVVGRSDARMDCARSVMVLALENQTGPEDCERGAGVLLAANRPRGRGREQTGVGAGGKGGSGDSVLEGLHWTSLAPVRNAMRVHSVPIIVVSAS